MPGDKIEKLLKWGRELGIEVPDGIEIVKSEDKGLTAICANPEGLKSPRISAPLNALITGDLAERALGKVHNNVLKLLLAKLKFDSKPTLIDGGTINLKQKFTPYLDTLPNVVDSPLIWNPQELSFLENTNLGNSWRERFYNIFKQWYDLTIDPDLALYNGPEIQHDIQIFQQWDTLTTEQIYEGIVKQTVELNPAHWCCFSAYLWSHLIFTSRAFPEYIINPGGCEESAIMLLPIIDLLNHDYTSKVEWSTNNNHSFILTLLNDDISQGDELFNNYGAKGNEELLNGYGFVLSENICDSVTLKIKLPLPVVDTILQTEPSIQLPIIDDYTTYAFDTVSKQSHNEKTRTVNDYKDGITFLLQETNDFALTSLLQLFTFLSKRTFEDIEHSIRPRLEGLQGLRNAIKRKLSDLKMVIPTDGKYSQYEIKEYRKYCAEIYRKSQIKILNHSLATLKKWEKEWLKEYRNQLLTMDKVLKYDTQFTQTELASCFAPFGDDVSFDSTFDLFTLWILLKYKNKSFIAKHQWVQDDLESYIHAHPTEDISVSPDTEAFYNAYFPNNDNQQPFTLKEVDMALQYITDNTFTRASGSEETILVGSSTH